MADKLEYIICKLSDFQACLDKYAERIKFIVDYDSTKIIIVIKKDN